MPGKSRRGRDEGGLEWRPKEGHWRASVSRGRKPDGKRDRKYVTARTKHECLEKLTQLRGELARGPKDATSLTVAQYLDQWLAVKKTKVEPGTFGPYASHVKRHLKPQLGTLRLAKLEPYHVQQMYAALSQAGTKPPTVRKGGTTLTVALNDAVRMRLIPSNPAIFVQKPRHTPPEMRPLGPVEVGRFLSAASGDRLYGLYAVALDTGMGPGELFGLHWPDVDLATGYVQVRRSLEEIGGKHRLKDVKAKSRRRRIKLTAFGRDALAAHRARMRAEGWDVSAGPIFCNTEGGFLSISNVTRDSFKPALDRAGLPRTVRFYDLRHTCATLLLLAGADAKVVAERLGHSTTVLTQNTYQHVLPGMQERAAEKLDAILKAAVGGRRAESETEPGENIA
jgi:integrase